MKNFPKNFDPIFGVAVVKLRFHVVVAVGQTTARRGMYVPQRNLKSTICLLSLDKAFRRRIAVSWNSLHSIFWHEFTSFLFFLSQTKIQIQKIVNIGFLKNKCIQVLNLHRLGKIIFFHGAVEKTGIILKFGIFSDKTPNFEKIKTETKLGCTLLLSATVDEVKFILCHSSITPKSPFFFFTFKIVFFCKNKNFKFYMFFRTVIAIAA